MPAIRQNSLHLCRIAGVDLYVHWSWFLVAVFEIGTRGRSYSSPLWNVLEYLALFAIVLMHEFGHVLACRSTGGSADQIMLWPLGGVAYVKPPQRPGLSITKPHFSGGASLPTAAANPSWVCWSSS